MTVGDPIHTHTPSRDVEHLMLTRQTTDEHGDKRNPHASRAQQRRERDLP